MAQKAGQDAPDESVITPRPELALGDVRLRPPQPGDRAARLASGRDPELVRLYGGDWKQDQPLTEAGVEQWYAKVARDPLLWIIEYQGQCVGHLGFHSLDLANRRARYVIGIFDRAFWGRGIGTQATRLALRYAFEVLQLHRVDLRVLSYNTRAIAAYEKCGFMREGVEREGALVEGEWHSDVMMSILEQEWEAHGGRLIRKAKA
jgi:[ribosomal protein S5]-alanine N-acetyltransferase